MINNKAHLVFLYKCDENEHAIGVESAGANAKGKTLMIKVIATIKNITQQKIKHFKDIFFCAQMYSLPIFLSIYREHSDFYIELCMESK